jgi:hypothetical protein
VYVYVGFWMDITRRGDLLQWQGCKDYVEEVT